MQATIEVNGLRKRFGPTLALDGMSFTVQPGQVTGFVGPNGAGKSTTMRVILSLDAPDEGKATIGGMPYASLRQPMRVIGSLLDAGALQPSRSARNHLLWLAHSQGLPARRVDEVIEQAGLEGVAKRRAGGYSLGMRQRLGIAAAMLGNPVAIMLDEPFNGMDPEGIVWMRGFLRSLAAEGRAVLVSSHLMSELQDTADHLVVVGRGKVIADTTVASLLAAASGDRVTLRTSARPEATTVLERAGATVVASGQDVLTISGLRRGAGRRAAGRGGRAVLRGLRAPGHAGAGLHGADQAGGRVPPGRLRRRRGGRRCRDDDPGHLCAAARTPASAADPAGGGFGSAAARRVDQVPQRARLGDRHDPGRAADHLPRRVRGRERDHRLPDERRSAENRQGLPALRPARAGRRDRDRQLLLRAPAADRERQLSPCGSPR